MGWVNFFYKSDECVYGRGLGILGGKQNAFINGLDGGQEGILEREGFFLRIEMGVEWAKWGEKKVQKKGGRIFFGAYKWLRQETYVHMVWGYTLP